MPVPPPHHPGASPTYRLVSTLVVVLVLLSGCIDPAVVTATGQRSVAVEEPVLETGPGNADDAAAAPVPTAEAPTPEPPTPEPPTPVPAPTATPIPQPPPIDATIPSDLCSESAQALVADGLAWTDLDLGRTPLLETATYVDTASDPSQSFLGGELSCAIDFDDGASLSVTAYTNYGLNTYPGTRSKDPAAGSIPMMVAADPEAVQVVVEYPWTGSPTGVAALEFAFVDPAGIEAGEIDAIEALAAEIRDRVAFVPPNGVGPTYPEWYACDLTTFGTPQGDTSALAQEFGQNNGLHAEEIIDRQFGSVRCSLYEGPGTQVTGGFAIGRLFIALAAYEDGTSSFSQTVQAVSQSEGVVEGTLEVGDTSYRTFEAEGTIAVIIEDGGNGVVSVFNPPGNASAERLRDVAQRVVEQLFG